MKTPATTLFLGALIVALASAPAHAQLRGHGGPGRAVAVSADRAAALSGRVDGAPPTIVTLPTPLSAVAVAHDGEIVAAGANGVVYFLDAAGQQKGEVQASPTPVIALAVSGDGKLVAAAGIRGSVAVIERGAR